MSYQDTFKRYELKYMMNREQKEGLLRAMEPHMALDQYGRTTIMNVYYDTPEYLLIRRSFPRKSSFCAAPLMRETKRLE